MPPKKTRQRQLQKLAERRAAERRRQRRRRVLAAAVAVAVAVTGLGYAGLAFLAGTDDVGEAARSSAPTPSPQVDPACGASIPAAAGEEKPMMERPPNHVIDETNRYTAVMTTSCGVIEMELFAQQTPKTVNNFVSLARDGFYDGLTFHRVIDGFMIQGGDPKGDGTGGPGYSFEDEIVQGLRFDKPYQLAMANSGPDTNGSQFFITVSEPSHLNGKHTIFGKVLRGQDVVDEIAAVPTGPGDRPSNPVYIESVEIHEEQVRAKK